MEKTLQEIVSLIKPEYRVLIFNEDIDVWDSDQLLYKIHGGEKLDFDTTRYEVYWVSCDLKQKTVKIGYGLKF